MTTATRPTVKDGYRNIDMDRIEVNPDQPRKHFDEDALEELAQSIRTHGLMQPIVVRPFGDGFQIVAGERRFRACKKVGLTKISARVMTIDDETTAILAITENVARRDMDEMEEANAYGSLVKLGKTIPEMAALFGKSEKWIETSLDMLNLIEQLQWMVAKAQISKNIGVYLSRLSLANQQATLARIMAGEFANNDALMRHCTVVAKVEQQGDGFFGVEVEDELTATRRKARRNEFELAWGKIEGLSVGLTLMMELAAEELAFALAGDTALYAQKLAVLATAVTRVRNNVRQAAAIAKVVLPEGA